MNIFNEKYEHLKKIIQMIKKRNNEIIIEDRLSYELDEKMRNRYDISKHLKCGKIMTNKKKFIEAIEKLDNNELIYIKNIIEYDKEFIEL